MLRRSHRSSRLFAARGRRWPLGALAVALALVAPLGLSAQEAPAATIETQRTQASERFGRLFDAVVATTARAFWDKELLASIGWEARAAEARAGVATAPTLEAAAGRINALLAELKTSHTVLLTPDDTDYYILLDVFSGSSNGREIVAERFPGGVVSFAGIGVFTARIDGRHFVDAVLEGSPAERAGILAGDEMVGVDGAEYHPIRSFRGKVGEEAAVTLRRSAGGPLEVIEVRVVAIAPLRAFSAATEASARTFARDGRRIGYVRVWASVGERSATALANAFSSLGLVRRAEGDRRAPGARQPPPLLDGLVIDMRGKIGGTANNASRYLELIDPRGPLIRSRNPARERIGRSVRGRTAVLVDHRTRSTAELFVHAYKRERQGPLIGTRTAGAVSAGHAFAMPGGNLLYLAVTGLEVDGEVVEGAGVAPDIEVARPLPYARGADPVLEAGIEALARGPAPGARANGAVRAP